MRQFLWSLPYPNKDGQVIRPPDPLIVGTTAHVIGNNEHILGRVPRPSGEPLAPADGVSATAGP